MKVAIIVQARMTSTRLPGKVLKTVLGKPLLEYQIERLKKVVLADAIVIATTKNESDEPIVQLAEQLDLGVFRGSETDVLSRYYFAAMECGAEVVVRVTSDCPLIDPAVIDAVIQAYMDSEYDYVSNTLQRTFPRGMDVEVFSFKALETAYQKADKQEEREHVTLYIYKAPGYKLKNVVFDRDESRHRWTVDTSEDFTLIKNIIERVYPTKPNFTLADCLVLLQENPHWASINQHVEQKK